ncbi:hypothetical protein M9H77_34606 [Catharanthus roseus]|uniref:Uncharacterized protein n=1 Tax=Catharanthus roseus TaxID=4058 RepID=A0ACB9ZMV3_CATRO|nr:hypothetical protein M9H77_34606 [Catharanthus roseus]
MGKDCHSKVKKWKATIRNLGRGSYNDEILCDVAPMQTRDLLSGHPWQYDRKAIHDVKVIEEFKDVFLEEMPSGLPPLRGIEHQIDLVLGELLPNRPTHRSPPKEAKELRKQVEELLSKGYVRENLSPCVVPILLVPKKDGT